MPARAPQARLEETTKIYRLPEFALATWHASEPYRVDYLKRVRADARSHNCHEWAVMCGEVELAHSGAAHD